MVKKIELDTSKLLGFDTKGKALLSTVKATGSSKQPSQSAAPGAGKMTGISGKT